MRQLATYTFEAPFTANVQGEMLKKLDGWLESKGKYTPTGESLILRDHRAATLARHLTKSSVGQITDLVLTEPTPDGSFRTTVSIAFGAELLAVSVVLAAASFTLKPIYLDVHCPRIVRDFLSLPASWTYHGTELSPTPRDFEGYSGGDDFASLVFDPTRAVPVVAVSDEHGGVLHPGIVEALASDLAGLAIVARLDPDASWRVTARKGKDWSCFGGAIRLYWAGIDEASASPYRNPLWTPRRLLTDVADTESAAGRIRSQLRRQIFTQAAFAISEAPLFGQIRMASRREQLEALRAKAEEDNDYKQLAEEYFELVHDREQEIEKRDEQIAGLREQVVNLTLALRWQGNEPADVEPDKDIPPATVEEAFLLATDRFANDLVFGEDCNEGIHTLASDAGPPDKILDYLEALAEMTQLRRHGPLGTTALTWLEQRGVIGSPESDTIKNSPKEQTVRTWSDGNGNTRVFDLHLKPSDATSPDRCVRIYFKYDEEWGKTIIGWVGRYP